MTHSRSSSFSHPSWAASERVSLSGKRQFQDAMKALDLESMPTGFMTYEALIEFPSPRPTIPTFLLVRPWKRYFELPDFADLSGSAELALLTTCRAKMTGLRPSLYYRIRPMGSLKHKSQLIRN
ncbi:hypothetical protein BDR07DRAFT_1410146 [Suillus spraguei]|nr:hypothetical protein BDR07DRAFT_1410146 [Suillus spraguei]